MFACIGGMGVGVSNWSLVRAAAKAASKLGIELWGTISLTAIAEVVARRLQNGDRDILRALDSFPVPEVAHEIEKKYFIKGGKRAGEPFRTLSLFSLEPSHELIWMNIFSSYAEVWLAKDGNPQPVGGNILAKIEMPIIYLILGAMLAKVQYFMVGAGLPTQIPSVIKSVLDGKELTYRLMVSGNPGKRTFDMRLDVGSLLEAVSAKSKERVADLLKEARKNPPKFYPIVTAPATARILESRIGKLFDGCVHESTERYVFEPVSGDTYEDYRAGGHNAKPRGWKGERNSLGEPVYGKRDEVDYEEILSGDKLRILAGGMADAAKRQELARFADGFQFGSLFALCEESPINREVKAELCRMIIDESIVVKADPDISPSGYPFQTVQYPGSISEESVREGRQKVCDLGYLRTLHCVSEDDWTLLCPAENPKTYEAKGGDIQETVGKGCLCNALLSIIGLPQIRKGRFKEPIVSTLGKELAAIRDLLIKKGGSYSVRDALEFVAI